MKKSALEVFLDNNKEMKVLSKTPKLGCRYDGGEFFDTLKAIKEATFAYRVGIYKKLAPNKNILSLGGGDPLINMPFPGTLKAVKKIFNSKQLSKYNHSAGDKEQRQLVLRYLNSLNISYYENVSGDRQLVTEDNIIFTSSTTLGFNFVLKSIIRPYDVVLFTGPTYGLFAYFPERLGGITKIIKLKEDCSFILYPSELENAIKNINKELKQKYKNKLNYEPRVVAFLNENPHNPTGVVLSIKEKSILEQYGKICSDWGVFLIDDLIYRELGYDRQNLALPIASFPQYFNSTITLMGLSKAYGLAGLRSGIVVAPKEIICNIRDQIFQQADSLSLVQSTALTYCLSQSKSLYYKKYFATLCRKYSINLEIIKYFVYGFNYSSERNICKRAKSFINKTLKSYSRKIFYDTSLNIKFAGNIIPKSGYFALLDFTAIKGQRFDDIIINTENDLLYYVFQKSQIKFLTGQSFAWPNKNELVARITYSLKPNDLIKRLFLIKNAFLDIKNT